MQLFSTQKFLTVDVFCGACIESIVFNKSARVALLFSKVCDKQRCDLGSNIVIISIFDYRKEGLSNVT